MLPKNFLRKSTTQIKNPILCRVGRFLILLFFVTLIGCSAVVKGVSKYEQCLNDATCRSEMELIYSSASRSTETILSNQMVEVSPVAGVIGAGVGTVCAIIWSLIKRNRKAA